MQQELETLKKWIDNSDNIVFFGGAGVSTESGIPDFRSVDGLYNQQYDYPPETILSHTFFRRNTEEFYRFYRAKMLALDAKVENNFQRIFSDVLDLTRNIKDVEQVLRAKKFSEIDILTKA